MVWNLVAAVLLLPISAKAGVVFGSDGLSNGFRWDVAPRTIDGLERSLDGGLRYSLSGGSFQSFRDRYSWSGPLPSVSDFTATVQGAFDVWNAVDPNLGVAPGLSFVPDLSISVDPDVVNGVRLGAEIDLIAEDFLDAGRRGFTYFNARSGDVELTSHVTSYNADPISGADITLNANAGALYTLDVFRRLLSHEIGHALGFGDVEGDLNPGVFIDDNYDGTSAATALATLTNPWSHLVNPADPSTSPLGVYFVSEGSPGTGTSGVNILMESRGLGIAPGNPVDNPLPLTADDFGIRQFLYPAILPADFNLDGTVDVTDLGILAANFRNSGDFFAGDASLDGTIDVTDLGILAASFRETTMPLSALLTQLGLPQMPEPMATAVLAFAGIGTTRRRK